MLFKSARKEPIWGMQESRYLLPPLGLATCQGHSQQQGQGQHQASLFCKRETEIWGFIFPNFLTQPWNRTNSTFHVLQENSYTLERHVRKPTHYWGAWWLKQRQTLRNYMKKRRTAPCKNSQLLLELVHQPLLLFFPLQSEFMVTPTLKSVNHKTTQDPALLQTKAQSSARVTGFIILYLLCHFPETRLFYF